MNSRVITFADRKKVSAGRSLSARPLPGPCSLAEKLQRLAGQGWRDSASTRASVGALEVRAAAFTRALRHRATPEFVSTPSLRANAPTLTFTVKRLPNSQA